MKDRKYLLISLYSYLVIFCIIGLFSGICFVIHSAVHGSIPFLTGSIIFTVFAAVTAVFTHICYKRADYGKSPLVPYKYTLTDAEPSHIFERLTDSLPFLRLDNAVLCARDLEGRQFTHWFIFSSRSFNAQEFRKLEKKSVLSAVDAGIIPRKMSRDTFLHSTRCSIIVTEHMNESLRDFLSRNAVDSLSAQEGIIYCAVDLSESAVYIPCLWGGVWAQLWKYKRTIKNLSRLLQFEL